MKPVREFAETTPRFSDYLELVGSAGSWDEFRSHDSGRAYRELRNVLTRGQHGLCAYCEIGLATHECQVEHVLPQSDPVVGTARQLDITNMLACCLGGTKRPSGWSGTDRAAKFLEPVAANTSCGQAKADLVDPRFVDPRTLPDAPALLRVLEDGNIQADEDACRQTNFAPDRLTRTIEILNLNADRLRRTRSRQWSDLVELSAQVADERQMGAWIRTVLSPDEAGNLAPFFTTSRSYFGPLSESILTEFPRDWI